MYMLERLAKDWIIYVINVWQFENSNDIYTHTKYKLLQEKKLY